MNDGEAKAMPKGFSKTTAAIQKLLDEREQIQTWLQRLSIAADTTPEPVRARVRADYERRLAEVMKELQGHGAELSASQERLESTRSGLARQEREAAERLAEAELRHAVGEYDEAQWRQVHAELVEALVKVREELKGADEELSRLAEVVSLIEAPSAPPPPPAASVPPASPRPKPVEPPRVEPPKREVAPPRKKEAAAAQQTELDELAFLRSVSEDERQGPAAARASGAMRAIEEPVAAPPAAGKDGVEAAKEKKESAPRASKATKSLKCRECGTMNLPTEWYCERCGAELAAL
jgi:hypothetical protein